MASSSSEAAAPIAVGEDPASPAKGEKRTKKEKKRKVLQKFHPDTLMAAEEFVEPLPPWDKEFLAQLREQRGQKGYVETVEEEGGNRAPPAAGRMGARKPGGGGKKLS